MAKATTLVVAAAVALTSGSAAAAAVTRHLLGHSRQGRAIYAYETGDPSATRRVLVVGCIDGNEPAGIAIAHDLEALAPPPGVDLWIVPVINPDGLAARTLGNAAGVDINRNFPYDWQRLPGPFASGPRALSEPESRAVHALILKLRPSLSIWFHQPLAVVDDSQGSVALERRFARLVGLPARPLTDYPGSVANWENHTLPGSTAFVVELPAGALTAARARRDAEAVLTVSRG
jgi:protein MpaA